ncbi:MAG: hypothetical protein PVF17_05960 [Ignavibacteria bacterium]|jgi:hypothetical protein
MKLYIYKDDDIYIVISSTHFISAYYGLTIDEAIDKYFKSSWDMSQNGHWLSFITKNKPILVIDSETHPEYFI